MKPIPLTPRAKRQLDIAAATLGFAFVIILLAALIGIRVPTTNSVPFGLYRTVTSGPFVEFCLSDAYAAYAVNRRYIAAGRCKNGSEPLMKPVVARAGDTVTIAADGIRVNDGPVLANSKPILRDHAGRPMAPFRQGVYHVAPGELWVVSSWRPNSFDSRYFGPINEREILHYTKPLW